MKSTKKRRKAKPKEDPETASVAKRSTANTACDTGSSSASAASQDIDIDGNREDFDIEKPDALDAVQEDHQSNLAETDDIEEEIVFVRDDSRLPRSPSLEDESGVLLPRHPLTSF